MAKEAKVKCYFSCIGSKKYREALPFKPCFMPIPRIGEILFIEGQDPCYKVIDVQYQFAYPEELYQIPQVKLVNVVLKKKKGKR